MATHIRLGVSSAKAPCASNRESEPDGRPNQRAHGAMLSGQARQACTQGTHTPGMHPGQPWRRNTPSRLTLLRKRMQQPICSWSISLVGLWLSAIECAPRVWCPRITRCSMGLRARPECTCLECVPRVLHTFLECVPKRMPKRPRGGAKSEDFDSSAPTPERTPRRRARRAARCGVPEVGDMDHALHDERNAPDASAGQKESALSRSPARCAVDDAQPSNFFARRITTASFSENVLRAIRPRHVTPNLAAIKASTKRTGPSPCRATWACDSATPSEHAESL